MRQQKHNHTVLSTHKCSVATCRTMIKQNVVDRKQEGTPILCHQHYLAKKRKGINS